MLLLFLGLTLGCVGNLETTSMETAAETEIEDSAIAAAEEVCANIMGFTSCNFTTTNSDGDEIEFHELMGKPVILDFSTMWCGPCNIAADEVQEVQDTYPDVVYLTVIIENSTGVNPTTEDLQSWKNSHGIEDAPVWAGSRDIITGSPIETAGEFYLSSWPTFYFLDDELSIVGYQKGFSSDIIEGWAASLSE